MKKASSSFLLVVFAALFVSLQSYAQISTDIGRPGHRPNRPQPMPEMPQMPQSEIMSEQVNTSMRSYERLRLSDLLRLSWQQQAGLEIRSLRILAQSLTPGQALLEVSQRGRILGSQSLRRQMSEASFILPHGTTLEGLELSSTSELYLSSITAEVERSRFPGGGFEQQVSPHSLVTLQVHQSVRGFANISLDQLLRQQQGLTLEGAEIERVIVEGQPLGYGRAASVQVELNRRPVGEIKYLSLQQRQLPLQVHSMEEARTLGLIVNGDAQIFEVRIRVGQVRSRLPQGPQSQTFYVNQEVSSRYSLELMHIIRYDSRPIRAITIHARSLRNVQSQLSLLANYGESQGTLFIGPHSVRARLPLRRPMRAHELRFEAVSPILIQSLEIEFESFPRY